MRFMEGSHTQSRWVLNYIYNFIYKHTHTTPMHTRYNEEVEFYWKIIGTTNTFSKMKWTMVYNVIIHTQIHTKAHITYLFIVDYRLVGIPSIDICINVGSTMPIIWSDIQCTIKTTHIGTRYRISSLAMPCHANSIWYWMAWHGMVQHSVTFIELRCIPNE